jgi:hypothetical protein
MTNQNDSSTAYGKSGSGSAVGSLERDFRDLLAADVARWQLLVDAALAALSEPASVEEA